MKKTFKLSRAMLSVFISVLMIVSGILSIGTQNAYAVEIDTNATYTTQSTSGYFSVGTGHEVGLTIRENGNFLALGACLEDDQPFPTGADAGDPAKYADSSKVDRNLNNGTYALDDTKIEQIKKIIYIYSETKELDDYFKNVSGDYNSRGKYEATWAAVAATAGKIPSFTNNEEWNNSNSEYGDRKGAYDYLMSKAQDNNVKVPAGLELAFFENIQSPAGMPIHKTQTMVALKLFGTEVKTPSIKNTTAKVNDTATNVELASGAEGTMTDEVTFENLETGKEYTVESTLLKDGSAFDKATTKVTGPATSVKVTFKKKITEAGKYQVKTVLTLDGKEVASHNDNLDVDTETVTVTVTEKPKDDKVTVKISKTDMNGKEVEGAVIVIKDKDGNEVLKWTSDKTVKSFEVAPGTYTLEETAAPEGYQKVSTVIEFAVDEKGNVTVNTTKVEPAGACEVVDGVLVLKDAAEENTVVETKKPVIKVKKTSETESANIGDQVAYTITVSNTGEGDANDVTVVDVLPEGLDYVSDDSAGVVEGQSVTWVIDLAAGKSKAITLLATINEKAEGKIINTVKVEGEEGVFEGSDDSAGIVLGVNESADDSGSDNGTAGTKKSPDTGDNAPLGLAAFGLIAAAALFGAIRRRRMN